MRNDGSSEEQARWVVVVPVADAPLFDYLTKSFASVPDVRVVLDRRQSRAVSETSAHDGRREDRRALARVVSNFGCAVIRRPPVAPETPPSRRRTLLWPHLRISDVVTWTDERAPRSVDAPPPNGRTS